MGVSEELLERDAGFVNGFKDRFLIELPLVFCRDLVDQIFSGVIV